MEKLRELMKEHQDKADKKVMGEVLELLQREPGLFVVTVHATKNFFLGAENGKAAAFLYTSCEYADEFVKGLEMVGVETKVLEIRPLQRISFFNDLYRSGFEAVVIDKGQENHMSMSLFSIIEKPKDTSEIVMNPSLVRSANQFYQALVQHQAFPQMQDLMCKELYGARLLVPVADPMTCSNHSERSGTASASKTTTEPTESSSNSKIAATHTVSADSSLPDKAHASSDNSITLRVTCRFLSFLPGGSE